MAKTTKKMKNKNSVVESKKKWVSKHWKFQDLKEGTHKCTGGVESKRNKSHSKWHLHRFHLKDNLRNYPAARVCGIMFVHIYFDHCDHFGPFGKYRLASR